MLRRRRILAGIASIPERADSLVRTVRSLAPQVDRVCVSLNEYAEWPEELDRFENVHATVRHSNGGDAEKFADVDDWDGIVLTCDDDLLYPPDYADRIVAGLERHPGAIVGFHGGKTLGWNGKHVAATHKQIRCLGALEHDDTDVNVLGTGAIGFDTSRVPVWRDVFRSANMADVHLACHAHRLGIPMVALAHQAGWLLDICPSEGRRIYESNVAGDGSSCDTRERRRWEMDRVEWARLAARPRVRVSIATCERPHLLIELLDDLIREAGWVDLDVAVFEDPSAIDYSDCREIVAQQGWEWHRMSERLGKIRHWELVNAELDACRASDADWYVFLPDDISLVRHAIPRAIDVWDRLDDPATLTLWRLKDHEGQPNWTGRLPVEGEHAFEVFHIDGIYLCRRETLEDLGYRVPGFPSRPRMLGSSGVGRGMSLHLHGKGRRMYRVPRSLAVPVAGEPSIMNPKARDRRYPGVAL